MSTAEYAAHRNVSDSYVRRMRRKGCLVLAGDDRIDAQASDQRLDEMLHPLQGGKRGGDDRNAAPPSAEVINVQEAVRRERLARARLAELELGTQSGQLTRVEDVNRVVFTLVRQALNQLQGMSGRLRKSLAAETDPFKISALIDEDVHSICREMRKAAAGLMETPAALVEDEDDDGDTIDEP